MLTYRVMPVRAGQLGSVARMAESTGEIEERQIVLTENAVRRIALLKVQEQAEDAFLRIAVSGGGCFDNKATPLYERWPIASTW